MKKSLLSLTLGILGVCQLGYSDINTEIEKAIENIEKE